MAEQQDQETPQPGSVINPGSVAPPPHTVSEETETEAKADLADQKIESVEPQDSYQKIDDGGSQHALTWEAPEFVAHDKSAIWYLLLIIGGATIAILLFLLTHDFITAGVVAVAALMLAVYGSHKPKLIHYSLDESGISIGKRRFNFEDFRSFSSANEAGLAAVVLMPLKRFAPPLSLYFAPQKEEVVTNFLADRLPYEQRRPDMVDSLMRRLRF